MYTCLNCYDSFLFQPEVCPTCSSLSTQRRKAKRVQERRANYDPAGQIPEAEFWQLLKWYPACPCCGTSWDRIPESICRDHIIPISRGGIHATINLQPLCQSCNLWKSDRLIRFDPAFPGRAAALPDALHSLFRRLSHYQPPSDPVQQLEFQLIMVTEVRFPQASPIQLEQQTLTLTWQALGVGSIEPKN